MSVITVTYVSPNGETFSVTTREDTTVMQAAVKNNVSGIVAECGGAMMCATCHVYVQREWQDKLPPISENEDATLSSTVSERTANSRLSCQLPLNASLDGLVVHLPKTQV